MNFRTALAGLLILAGVTLATAQTTAPTTAPKDLELIDAQGYQKILQQYKGKPLVVTFWATWCEPCRDELPLRLRCSNEGRCLFIDVAKQRAVLRLQ